MLHVYIYIFALLLESDIKCQELEKKKSLRRSTQHQTACKKYFMSKVTTISARTLGSDKIQFGIKESKMTITEVWHRNRLRGCSTEETPLSQTHKRPTEDQTEPDKDPTSWPLRWGVVDEERRERHVAHQCQQWITKLYWLKRFIIRSVKHVTKCNSTTHWTINRTQQ